MADTWLIVGLGNPGPRYEATRHNVGQMVIDELAVRRGESFKVHKAGARVAETWLRPGGPKLVLAKPNTFMNVSGGPVANLAKFYGIEADHVIVLHDELDIPFDTIKLKTGGGHGGHNGVRDVAKALDTPDFARCGSGSGDRSDDRTLPTGSWIRSARPSARTCRCCWPTRPMPPSRSWTRGSSPPSRSITRRARDRRGAQAPSGVAEEAMPVANSPHSATP